MENQKLKLIGSYDKNDNRINFAISFNDFEDKEFEGCKVPDMDCLKKHNILQIPIDGLDISKSDKCLLTSLQQDDVIIFNATMKEIDPTEEQAGVPPSFFKYIRIWNIKKYNKPKAFERLSNIGRHHLYNFHFIIKPTMIKQQIGMLLRIMNQ